MLYHHGHGGRADRQRLGDTPEERDATSYGAVLHAARDTAEGGRPLEISEIHFRTALACVERTTPPIAPA